MIIKNMEEFGAARDAEKQVQLLSTGHWFDKGFITTSICAMEDLIKRGVIRTKPKTTYFRIFRDDDGTIGAFEDHEPFPDFWQEDGPRKFLFDYTLEEGDD